MGNPNAAKLAKQFEPILLFHPDEKVFPIDPKFYLERCALWRNAPSSDDKSLWGEKSPSFPRKPLVGKGQLASLASERGPSQVWLGNTPAISAPNTFKPNEDDWFLQLTGWEPFALPPDDVTIASDNNRPTLGASFYDHALAGSKPWYYVEFLSFDDLQRLAQIRPNGLDLPELLSDSSLNTPQMLVYYYFHALHEEPIPGCNDPEGQSFGTFAGEWAAVVILLDNDSKPLFIGTTARNGGDPGGDTIWDERRIGMTVSHWDSSDLDLIDEHPKLFVSKGTHGYYIEHGSHPVLPMTSGGFTIDGQDCGDTEKLADGLDVSIPPEDDNVGGIPTALFIAKVAAGGLAGLAGGVGFVGAALAIQIEEQVALTGYTQAESPDKPLDETGGPQFSLILQPAGLFVPESAGAQRTVDWPTASPAAGDKPAYDFIVDRTTQLWWPMFRGAAGDVGTPGYIGRWGPAVTSDPRRRRAGMRCPSFPLMFLEALARS
jgi:hypothetical protein